MHTRKISVVGLGYVGLPVAVAFGKQGKTIGFDTNNLRLSELRAGVDRTHEVDKAELARANLVFTADTIVLAEADFHIVAVPTPVNNAHQPDLTSIAQASDTVAQALKKRGYCGV